MSPAMDDGERGQEAVGRKEDSHVVATENEHRQVDAARPQPLLELGQAVARQRQARPLEPL